MAFSQLDINNIKNMALHLQFNVKGIDIIGLYYNRNDTLYILKKEEYEVLGCFSGDGYFSKPDGTNVPHSRIDWTQNGCSYETTVLPTYVSFLTTYLGT